MKYAVIIERDPETQSVAAYSPDAEVYVVRDASTSDDEMLSAFKESLAAWLEAMLRDGLPIPEPRHRAAMVDAA
jgi:predicted RNase H-like HicB family nuclease